MIIKGNMGVILFAGLFSSGLYQLVDVQATELDLRLERSEALGGTAKNLPQDINLEEERESSSNLSTSPAMRVPSRNYQSVTKVNLETPNSAVRLKKSSGHQVEHIADGMFLSGFSSEDDPALENSEVERKETMLHESAGQHIRAKEIVSGLIVAGPSDVGMSSVNFEGVGAESSQQGSSEGNASTLSEWFFKKIREPHSQNPPEKNLELYNASKKVLLTY